MKNFFDNLSREDIVILKRVINYKNSIKDKVLLIFDKRIRAGYMPKDLYRWIRIIMNKY